MTLTYAVLILFVGTTLLGGVLAAIYLHLATNRAISSIDSNLARLQGKLDVLVAAQAENNAKLDSILLRYF